MKKRLFPAIAVLSAIVCIVSDVSAENSPRTFTLHNEGSIADAVVIVFYEDNYLERIVMAITPKAFDVSPYLAPDYRALLSEKFGANDAAVSSAEGTMRNILLSVDVYNYFLKRRLTREAGFVFYDKILKGVRHLIVTYGNIINRTLFLSRFLDQQAPPVSPVAFLYKNRLGEQRRFRGFTYFQISMNASGSTGMSFIFTMKWRCGPTDSPLAPARPITCPFVTCSPACTMSLLKWR